MLRKDAAEAVLAPAEQRERLGHAAYPHGLSERIVLSNAVRLFVVSR